MNAPGGRWVVLCHNCAAFADSLEPPARSIEGLKMRLARDRRWGDRRAAPVGRPSYRDPALERRAGARRRGNPHIYAATDLVDELIIEMEAEYEPISDDQIGSSEDVTGIHSRIPLPE